MNAKVFVIATVVGGFLVMGCGGDGGWPGLDQGAQRIVFQRFAAGNVDTFSMKADGTDVVNLTNHVAFDTSPSYSYNGKKIVFASNRDSGDFSDIYSMDSDGANVTRLTTDPAADGFPRYSPDGTKIVFSTNRNGPFNIYVMDADGQNQTNLTSGFHPNWSPDGTKIVFKDAGAVSGFAIWVVDADGQNRIQLTNTGNPDSPCFSPDGTKIVYQTGTDGNEEIYVMDADGGNQQAHHRSSH